MKLHGLVKAIPSTWSQRRISDEIPSIQLLSLQRWSASIQTFTHEANGRKIAPGHHQHVVALVSIDGRIALIDFIHPKEG